MELMMELAERAFATLQHAESTTRHQAAGQLDRLIDTLEQGLALWRGVDSDKPRHPLGSIFSMVGGTVSEQLFDLHMASEHQLKAFCGLAGPAMAARATMPPPLVETAYWQLDPEETLAARVARNLALMTRRLERLREMRGVLAADQAAAGAEPSGGDPYRLAA